MKANFQSSIGITAAIAASMALATSATPADKKQPSEQCETLPGYPTCRDIAAKVIPAAATSEPLSGWRLVKSKDPNGGADAVAIMHTADISKSDIGLAGLMLRCSGKDVEVVVITTIPFTPHARPHIKLRAGKTEANFNATVVPPFSALLLPMEATQLADSALQTASELSVQVDDQQTTVRGIVALTGLPAALANLRANCPATSP
jgi:hypothetical protein